MTLLTPMQNLAIFADTLFVLGLITFATGLLILYRAAMHNIPSLTQTARVVSKAAFESVQESLTQASSLLSTLHDLTQTNRGIGLVLMFTGILLMGVSGGVFFWLAGRV
ncbi:MAG: hypothetical protein D6755_12795 [Anaerolineae bacterium]|nr:MAG: hypothetical protein D6755_12795 [Anaerolineae bacterium]